MIFSQLFTVHIDNHLPNPIFNIVNAQTFQPATVMGPSYAFIEGRALYVTGGSNYQTIVSQTFSIDLSSSWEINAPKFELLSSCNGSPDYQVPSALISEQAGWIVFSNYRAFRYNIQSDYGEGHKAPPSNTRSPQAVSPVPSMIKEERNPQGLIVPSSYVD